MVRVRTTTSENPLALALILTHNLQTEVKSKMSALKKGLQREPAFPDGSPARRAIMGAWKTSHPGVPPPSEIRAHRHRGRRVTRTLGQDRQHQRLNHRIRRALWVFTSQRTYLQQAHGKRGQQTQQTDQAINRGPLPVLNATSAFQTLMIILDQPPISIPVHPLPGLFERRGGDRGKPDPFQRLLAFGSLLFPDANDPHGQGLLARARGISGWQERHLSKGKLQLGRTRLATMPGWNWRLDGSPGLARTVRASANR